MRSRLSDALRQRVARLLLEAPWSLAGLVLAVVLVVFAADLLVLSVTERWWQHRLGVWAEILVDDAALSAICRVR